jgi:hypothetical protein
MQGNTYYHFPEFWDPPCQDIWVRWNNDGNLVRYDWTDWEVNFIPFNDILTSGTQQFIKLDCTVKPRYSQDTPIDEIKISVSSDIHNTWCPHVNVFVLYCYFTAFVGYGKTDTGGGRYGSEYCSPFGMMCWEDTQKQKDIPIAGTANMILLKAQINGKVYNIFKLIDELPCLSATWQELKQGK